LHSWALGGEIVSSDRPDRVEGPKEDEASKDYQVGSVFDPSSSFGVFVLGVFVLGVSHAPAAPCISGDIAFRREIHVLCAVAPLREIVWRRCATA
jgi:hypothetical protein